MWPIEIVVLVMHYAHVQDLESFVKGMGVQKSPVIKEYMGRRLKTVVSIHGSYFEDEIDRNHCQQLCVIDKDKHGDWNHFDSIYCCLKLKRLHMKTHNVDVLSNLFDHIPPTLEILEILIDGNITGCLRRYKQKNHLALNLKMLTIVNKSHWNQKKIQKIYGYSAQELKRQVDLGRNTETTFLRGYGKYKMKRVGYCFDDPKYGNLQYLGSLLSNIVKDSFKTIQNVGCFGLDICWIFHRYHSAIYGSLRIIKTDCNSMLNLSIWKHLLSQKNLEFVDTRKLKPMVAIFSRSFENNCKIIDSLGNCAYVNGSAMKLLQQYTVV